MINAQDIKIGTAIRMDGKLYFCIDFLHVKPGKGNTFMRTKLKDVVNGYVLERRFNIGEKLEDVRVERRPYQFLYKEGEDYIFMNQETYDQVPIPKDQINGVDYLLEGQKNGTIRPDLDLDEVRLQIAAIATGIMFYWCVFEGNLDAAGLIDRNLASYLWTLETKPEA